MKKSFYSLLIAALFSISSLCAHGAEATAQAIVLKVTGTVHAISAGQTESVIVKVGDKLPQGATIVTDANSEVDVQAFNGAVATIKAGSTVNLEKLSVTTADGVVTKQTALLSLKVGVILSEIDPANHNINDYSIRTPKGVAAARGTSYGVQVKTDGTVQLFVTTSAVTFYNTTTGKSLTVPAGSAVAVLPNGNMVQIEIGRALDDADVKFIKGHFKDVTVVGDTTDIPSFDPNAQPQSNSQ